jgi:ABC-type phosphate transport system substrate-binding protein
MRSLPRLGLVLLALTSSGAGLAADNDVVAIVSAKSAIGNLDRAQVADIFLGKIGRLPDGGKPVPVDLPEGSAAREKFYTEFTGKSAAQVKAHWSKIIFTGRGQPPTVVADGRAALAKVAESPSTIAYVERHLVDESVRVVAE